MADRRSFLKGAATALAGMFTGFFASEAVAKPGLTKGLESAGFPDKQTREAVLKNGWHEMEPLDAEEFRKQLEEAMPGLEETMHKATTRRNFAYGMSVQLVNMEKNTIYEDGMTGCVIDVGYHSNEVVVWIDALGFNCMVKPENLEQIDSIKRKIQHPDKDDDKLYCIVQAGVIPCPPNEDFHPFNIRPAKEPMQKDDSHRAFWLEQVPTVTDETTKNHEKLKAEGKIPKDAVLWPRTKQFQLVPEIQIGTKHELIQLMAERMASAFKRQDEPSPANTPASTAEAQEILREARRDHHFVCHSHHPLKCDCGVGVSAMMYLRHPVGLAFDELLAKRVSEQARLDLEARAARGSCNRVDMDITLECKRPYDRRELGAPKELGPTGSQSPLGEEGAKG